MNAYVFQTRGIHDTFIPFQPGHRAGRGSVVRRIGVAALQTPPGPPASSALQPPSAVSLPDRQDAIVAQLMVPYRRLVDRTTPPSRDGKQVTAGYQLKAMEDLLGFLPAEGAALLAASRSLHGAEARLLQAWAAALDTAAKGLAQAAAEWAARSPRIGSPGAASPAMEALPFAPGNGPGSGPAAGNRPG